MNIEATIIQYLTGVLDVPVSADVPTNRPASFVTVERTGGGISAHVIDTAFIAIQSWSNTRYNASELCGRVDTAMDGLIGNTNITRVSRDGMYNWPDPDYSMARYQATYEIVFYKED